jgi:MFS family permease
MIPRVVRRNTLLLALALALATSTIQLIPPWELPWWSDYWLGQLAGIGFSIIALSRILMAYPFGKLADVLGRVPGLVLGFGVGIVGAVVLAYAVAAGSFPACIVGMLLFGAANAAGQQVRVAAADMYPPAVRAEGLGFVLTASVLGALGGPMLIASAERFAPYLRAEPLAISWALAPVVLLPSALILLLVRPDPKTIAADLQRYYPGYRPPATEVETSTAVSFMSLLRDQRKVAIFVTSGVAQGQMATLMALNSLMLAHHGHSFTAISAAVAIHIVGMFGLSLPLGRLADRIGRGSVLLVGLALSATGAILLPATTAYVAIVFAIFLVGLGWSCVNVGEQPCWLT